MLLELDRRWYWRPDIDVSFGTTILFGWFHVMEWPWHSLCSWEIKVTPKHCNVKRHFADILIDTFSNVIFKNNCPNTFTHHENVIIPKHIMKIFDFSRISTVHVRNSTFLHNYIKIFVFQSSTTLITDKCFETLCISRNCHLTFSKQFTFFPPSWVTKKKCRQFWDVVSFGTHEVIF